MSDSMTKTEVVRARALPEERRALDLIAQQERRRPSEVIRDLIRAEAQRRGLWPAGYGREVTR